MTLIIATVAFLIRAGWLALLVAHDIAGWTILLTSLLVAGAYYLETPSKEWGQLKLPASE